MRVGLLRTRQRHGLRQRLRLRLLRRRSGRWRPWRRLVGGGWRACVLWRALVRMRRRRALRRLRLRLRSPRLLLLRRRLLRRRPPRLLVRRLMRLLLTIRLRVRRLLLAMRRWRPWRRRLEMRAAVRLERQPAVALGGCLARFSRTPPLERSETLLLYRPPLERRAPLLLDRRGLRRRDPTGLGHRSDGSDGRGAGAGAAAAPCVTVPRGGARGRRSARCRRSPSPASVIRHPRGGDGEGEPLPAIVSRNARTSSTD